MVEGVPKNKNTYTDSTGEIAVFEGLLRD